MHTPQDSSQFENTLPQDNCKLPAGLYIVGTPLGNLGDMTFRAIDTLRSVGVIACEDTRVTGVLTQHFGISTKRVAYHDHNGARLRPQIITWIQEGQAVALVSDAGMPLINDPGYKLVVAVRDAGLAVTCIPGATALVTALVLSGLPGDRFSFQGFLPEKSAARRTTLQSLQGVDMTTIFYESPKRLEGMLLDMAAVLPQRRIAVARELTKKFEEVVCDFPACLLERYQTQGFPRGEMVVMIEGAPADQVSQDMDAFLTPALEVLSLRDAAALVARQLGLSKGDVYKRALALKENPDVSA